MSRDTSLTFREAVFSQETGEAFIVLVTIDHDDIVESIRVCSNATDIVSRGDTFLACPFEFTLPDDSDERISAGSITIDNVSSLIAKGIRLLTTPPTVKLEVVLASSPDSVEASFENFELIDVQYDANTIKGNLSIQSFMTEPYPGGIQGPANFPGLF